MCGLRYMDQYRTKWQGDEAFQHSVTVNQRATVNQRLFTGTPPVYIYILHQTAWWSE